MLTTERLTLRKWVDEDAEALYELAKDPDVGPSCGWPPHQSVEGSLDCIRNVLNAPECYAICKKEDHTLIGCIELMLPGHNRFGTSETESELGFWMGKPFWGNGYMPEAAAELMRYGFEDLGMTKIWCGHFYDNQKSKRTQEKMGFVYERTVEHLPLPLLHSETTLIVNVLTKEEWKKRK